MSTLTPRNRLIAIVLTILMGSSVYAAAGYGHPLAVTSVSELVVNDDAPAWTDWSWDTTVNAGNTASVWSGSASIAVAYDADWGGLTLHTIVLISGPDYDSLRFWIHGGRTGARLSSLC